MVEFIESKLEPTDLEKSVREIMLAEAILYGVPCIWRKYYKLISI